MKFNACGGSNKVRSLYLGLWFLLKCYSLEQQVSAAGCFFTEATIMSQGLILVQTNRFELFVLREVHATTCFRSKI